MYNYAAFRSKRTSCFALRAPQSFAWCSVGMDGLEAFVASRLWTSDPDSPGSIFFRAGHAIGVDGRARRIHLEACWAQMVLSADTFSAPPLMPNALRDGVSPRALDRVIRKAQRVKEIAVGAIFALLASTAELLVRTLSARTTVCRGWDILPSPSSRHTPASPVGCSATMCDSHLSPLTKWKSCWILRASCTPWLTMRARPSIFATGRSQTTSCVRRLVIVCRSTAPCPACTARAGISLHARSARTLRPTSMRS